MTLIRYNNERLSDPFSDFEKVVGQLFGSRCGSGFGSYAPAAQVAFRADWQTSENGYQLRAELPGVSRESIKVSLENSVLKIGVEGDSDDSEANERARHFRIGEDVDPENVAASYKDGLLTVDLPKREEKKARSIKIEG